YMDSRWAPAGESPWLGSFGATEYLQADNSGDDERDAGDTSEGRRLAKDEDAEGRGANRTNTGPDGIGGADRKLTQGKTKKPKARGRCDQGSGGELVFRETLRRLHADRPDDLE